jgi:hypothetical protein
MNDTRFCAKCQAYVPRIGIHSCVKVARPRPSPPPVKNTEAPVKNAVKNVDTVKNAVQSKPKPSSSARTKKWREAHPEKAKNYMRSYMQKRRAKE